MKTFGEFAVVIDGSKISFARAKSKQLFLWLLLEYPRQLHEEVIIEMLWPNSPVEKSRQNLQKTVSDLRKSLDPESLLLPRSYVLYDSHHYFLEIPGNSQIDFQEFTNLHASIIGGADISAVKKGSHEDSLEKSIDLYEDDLVPEMRFEAFMSERRESLRLKMFDLLTLYLRTLLDRNDFQRAEVYVRKALTLDPLWSTGVKLAMELYLRSDRTLLGIKIYRKFERTLKEELDLDPEPELRELFEQMQMC